jgi:hypothetical protein
MARGLPRSACPKGEILGGVSESEENKNSPSSHPIEYRTETWLRVARVTVPQLIRSGFGWRRTRDRQKFCGVLKGVVSVLRGRPGRTNRKNSQKRTYALSLNDTMRPKMTRWSSLLRDLMERFHPGSSLMRRAMRDRVFPFELDEERKTTRVIVSSDWGKKNIKRNRRFRGYDKGL